MHTIHSMHFTRCYTLQEKVIRAFHNSNPLLEYPNKKGNMKLPMEERGGGEGGGREVQREREREIVHMEY